MCLWSFEMLVRLPPDRVNMQLCHDEWLQWLSYHLIVYVLIELWKFMIIFYSYQQAARHDCLSQSSSAKSDGDCNYFAKWKRVCLRQCCNCASCLTTHRRYRLPWLKSAFTEYFTVLTVWHWYPNCPTKQFCHCSQHAWVYDQIVALYASYKPRPCENVHSLLTPNTGNKNQFDRFPIDYWHGLSYKIDNNTCLSLASLIDLITNFDEIDK